MIKKIFPILFFAVYCFQISFSQDGSKVTPQSVTEKRIVAISFKLDLSKELKKVQLLSSIGIRGNTAPLLWDKTYRMTDDAKNGIYKATIKFETTEPNLRIEYKYFHDTASWEDSKTRIIVTKDNQLSLPTDTWNFVLPENTRAYYDSVELQKLYNTIAGLDSLLFDAYNNCKMDQYAALFSENLEFYHDKGGLSTSKTEMVEAVQKNICNKVKRELLKGSIEVSPIAGYGAVELGQHRFHNLVENSISRYSKFVVIWQYKNNEWKVTRVISLH